MKALLAILLFGVAAARLPAQEEVPRYAKFPAPATDLLFSAFQTKYAYETDAEDLYPIVLQITRQGVPLWSQIATVDPGWPFLNLDFKAAWSPDGKCFACSYRTSRATLVALGLAFPGGPVQQQTFAIDELEDAVLEKSRDTSPRVLSKAWAEAVEVGNDGIVRLTMTVARSQGHRLVATFDAKSGALREWRPAPSAAK